MIDVPIYAWRGGIPTPDEAENAPNFTFFPSPVMVDGLREGEVAEEPSGALVWFISEVGPHYESNVEMVLRKIQEELVEIARQPADAEIQTTDHPEINDDLRGSTVRFRGRDVKLVDDAQAWGWAIESGRTLFKVPESLVGEGQKYTRYYVQDYVVRPDGHDEQWSMREFLLGAPTPDVAEDLRTIQAHRRRIGQRPLDPQAAGWGPEDIQIEAKRIRSLNPRCANVPKLKRRLLR